MLRLCVETGKKIKAPLLGTADRAPVNKSRNHSTVCSGIIKSNHIPPQPLV